MIAIILIDLYLIVALVLLVSKDAASYLMFTRATDPDTIARMKSWHIEGALLYVLYIVPCIILDSKQWLLIIFISLFLRLSLYDIGFNIETKLGLNYVGSTSVIDKFMSKIFGKSGGLVKSGIAFLIFIILHFFA